jgi:hypothetical protein
VERESAPANSEPANASLAAVPRTRWKYLFVLPLAAGLLVWGLNYILVQRSVTRALTSDPRNGGYSLAAHYHFYVEPSTLVLDLRDVPSAAPLDLFRGLFQAAAALASAGRHFNRVILARAGTPVFTMTGEDFRRLGTEFAAGQNPVFLIRTLPEKLHNPTGEAAFAHWEGGVIGVLGKQMEDANAAARRWAGPR